MISVDFLIRDHKDKGGRHKRMTKRILVTGGAGYVGRELARQLYAGNEVCIIDRLFFGSDRLSVADRESVTLEQIDIRDAAAVAQVIARFQPEVIVHLAAVHFIPACENDPEGTVLTNVAGTVNLLLHCPPGCRFVFASSGAVYQPSAEPHHEVNSVLAPSDVYGLTKLHGEQFVRYFSAQRGFAAVIVRLFNVVGPGETNQHLLPEIVAQMKAGYPAIRLGNMWPKRDYIHVRDAAAGFRATALAGTVAPGEAVIVNLGTSLQYSVAEIADRLRAVSGRDFAVEHDMSRARKVDRPFLSADIYAIRESFGWFPRLTIDDAIADLWDDPDLSSDLARRYGLERSAR